MRPPASSKRSRRRDSPSTDEAVTPSTLHRRPVIDDLAATHGDEVAELQQHALDDLRAQEYLVVHFLAGGQRSGKIKTGLHVKGDGEPGSRVGLTVQQAMGLSINAWGVGSMRTARPLTELFV